MPDPGHILASLATYAAFRLYNPTAFSGDTPSHHTRLWLMIVGGPSGGKTEGVNAISECPQVYQASLLTIGGLLSGSSKKDTTKEATGGLLRAMGDKGFLVMKDFTSVLTMPREAKQQVLSALREIYDGKWTRLIGSDGGKSLSWEGHMGLLVGVTTEIDSHFEVMNKLGERFLYYRLPEMDTDEQQKQAARALDFDGYSFLLTELVEDFFEGLSFEKITECTPQENDFLIALSTLVVRGRSSVDRDGYTRTLEFKHAGEAPARLVKQLKLLLTALAKIGVRAPYRHEIVRKVALDSMPPMRCEVLCAVAQAKGPVTKEDLSKSTNLTKTMIYRALEELQVHGIVFSKPVAIEAKESSNEEKTDKKSDTTFLWELRPNVRELWVRSLGVSDLSVVQGRTQAAY